MFHDSAPRFRRSSFCGSGGCVEIAADARDDSVLIKDAKVVDGPVQRYTPAEWDAFVAGVKAGEFDRFRL